MFLPSVSSIQRDLNGSLPPAAPPRKRVCTRAAAGATRTDLPSVRSLLNPTMEPNRAGPATQKASKCSPKSPEEGGSVPSDGQHVRRREQCRTNQQRYRDKQKFAVLRLEADVLQLRQAIKMHELTRDAWTDGRSDTDDRVRMVVTEFFSMFRFGLSGASLALPIRPHVIRIARSGLTSSREGKASVTLLAPSNADDQIVRAVLPQLAFLHVAFAADVEFGGLRGRDALVEQLWRYSCYFFNMRLEMERVQLCPRGEDADTRHDSVFVVATGSLALVVSPATMTHVFLHAEHDEWVSSRLVGKKLECAVEFSFEFERRGGEYEGTRISMKLDLLGALRTALGRLDAVANVLEHALVTPEGLLGDLRNHPTGSTCSSSSSSGDDPKAR